MGITGLIPFVEKASTKTHLDKIKENKTVAVDAYCWLHKGAFACSEILVRGGKTNVHIQYCLKYVKMLLSYGFKPILVFDGRHLPAKELTEKKRRETRKQAKRRGLELLRLGKHSEAQSCFKRCVDITHEMALELIKECRKINVDCIVAPYEADGQLAYLNQIGAAEYIITEDSDLLLFGCKKILFKLDLYGSCLLVNANLLHEAMECRKEKFTFDKFMYMCILSGCDYLDSLPGIGLSKARKFILKTEDDDIKRALGKIPSYLNMRHLKVTEEYKINFLKAVATFKHMVVYDPFKKKQVRLTDPNECQTNLDLCSHAGEFIDDDTAFELALGNLNPFTLKKLDDWNPSTQTKNKKLVNSIWSSETVFQNIKKAQFFGPPKSSVIQNNNTITSPSCDNMITFSESNQEDLINQYFEEPSKKKQKLEEDKSKTIEETKPLVKPSFMTKIGKNKKTVVNNSLVLSRFFKVSPDLASQNSGNVVTEENYKVNTKSSDVLSEEKTEECEKDNDNNVKQKEIQNEKENYAFIEEQNVPIVDIITCTEDVFKENDEKNTVSQCNETVDLTNNSTPQCILDKKKKQTCRQPGIAKSSKNINSTQTRLSMFGFQKKSLFS